jgi:hypothetical protein
MGRTIRIADETPEIILVGEALPQQCKNQQITLMNFMIGTDIQSFLAATACQSHIEIMDNPVSQQRFRS